MQSSNKRTIRKLTLRIGIKLVIEFGAKRHFLWSTRRAFVHTWMAVVIDFIKNDNEDVSDKVN